MIGPAATVAQALELLQAEPDSGGVLAARLADRDDTPVALVLARLGVPFVIHTGAGPRPD